MSETAIHYYYPPILPRSSLSSAQFKEINNANAILADEKKRKIYDAYGMMGLKLAEQVGEEVRSTTPTP